jgi:SAM-dependent methyltransferase
MQASAAAGDLRDLLARLDRALARVDAVEPLGERRFLETHVLYEDHSDQRRRIIEWFGERVLPAATRDRPFRVLSIGCGSGLLDVPVAARLAARTGDLRYTGVDPSRIECEAFARCFDDAALTGARLRVVAAPFEAFQAPPDFDLVHLVHCLYYMLDPTAVVDRAWRLLAPGGRLVVLHAPRGALNDLAARFYDKQFGRPTLFADEFAGLLDRRGWFYERERIDAQLEVSAMVRGDEDVGSALRDFIVQVDSRRLPPAVLTLVERYLDLVTVEDGGRFVIDHPVDAFVIGG